MSALLASGRFVSVRSLREGVTPREIVVMLTAFITNMMKRRMIFPVEMIDSFREHGKLVARRFRVFSDENKRAISH